MVRATDGHLDLFTTSRQTVTTSPADWRRQESDMGSSRYPKNQMLRRIMQDVGRVSGAAAKGVAAKVPVRQSP